MAYNDNTTYSVCTEDGAWIGGSIYAEIKYAITAAKRSVSCATKRGETRKLYIYANNDALYGIYGKKVALVSENGAEIF